MAFLILSSALATVAILTGSIPILIGAMILSPTFDPLIAVPFGLIRRDWSLFWRGTAATLVLFALAFLVCWATVRFFLLVPVLPTQQGIVGAEILRERLAVGWGSFLTALAAGAGGAIAFVSERRLHLVGVVIAVALIPTLAAAAIAFTASALNGWNGMALFGVNCAGIVVAGYLILLLRVFTGKAKDHHRSADARESS
ncbi:MAG: DUF389 domain-containing protein [Armatimonadota bacterium]